MHRTSIMVPGLVIFLAASLLVAGCSTPGTGDETAQPTTTAITGALYSEGDIVRNPTSTAGTAWLVIGYDPAGDTYERALIYQNADGSWGHRLDTRTEKTGRAVMEKVYTELVANKLPSSVPVVTPTIVTPEETTRAAVTTSVTPTTTPPGKPAIKKIIPEIGFAGTTVTVTDLVGENFVTGANVTLSRSGSTSIRAAGERVISPKSITCTLAIPADAVAGSWDVTVTNPDGQSSTFTNIFTVRRDTSVITTTSTLSVGTVPVTYMDPPFGFAGYNSYIITGSKFKNGAEVKLQKDGKTDIKANQVIFQSDTQLKCFFQIPAGSTGFWNIRVTNPDQTYGIRYDGFEIK